MKNHATVEYRNMLHKNLAGALSELRETCAADYTKPEGGFRHLFSRYGFTQASGSRLMKVLRELRACKTQGHTRNVTLLWEPAVRITDDFVSIVYERYIRSSFSCVPSRMLVGYTDSELLAEVRRRNLVH